MARDQDMDLDGAMEVARAAHDGQLDKAGEPYIGHPMRVMGYVEDHAPSDPAALEMARMAAVLHDVVEDSEVTLDDLRAGGCPEPVVRAVAALTKSKDGDETPEAYAARVAADPIALAVKRADLRDNGDEQRLAKLPEEKAERLRQKYRHMTALLDGHEGSGLSRPSG